MRPQARSGTGRLDPRSFLSLPWIVSQRGAVAAPVLTKTLTAKNQRGGVRQPVRHRPSAVGNEPKRNARRPCMITQRLGAEEGDTPVDQQPAAMQDFDPTLSNSSTSGRSSTTLYEHLRTRWQPTTQIKSLRRTCVAERLT